MKNACGCSSARDRRALLDGVWELDEGRYFSEFSPDLQLSNRTPSRGSGGGI